MSDCMLGSCCSMFFTCFELQTSVLYCQVKTVNMVLICLLLLSQKVREFLNIFVSLFIVVAELSHLKLSICYILCNKFGKTLYSQTTSLILISNILSLCTYTMQCVQPIHRSRTQRQLVAETASSFKTFQSCCHLFCPEKMFKKI